MNEDRKPGGEPDETEDPVISFIKQFQIQIKREKKDGGFQTEEKAEDQVSGSGREEDSKSKS